MVSSGIAPLARSNRSIAPANRARADTGAIDPLAPGLPDHAHEVEILLLRMGGRRGRKRESLRWPWQRLYERNCPLATMLIHTYRGAPCLDPRGRFPHAGTDTVGE